MGMDPFNFADALLGGLAQRLAKALRLQSYNPASRNSKSSSRNTRTNCRLPAQTDAGESQQPLDEWMVRYAEGGQLRFYKAVAATSATRPVTKAALAARS
jgi:type II secretory ATPase GspE/PulE/Tfp pilus assembly ATPase PilB-like protein